MICTLAVAAGIPTAAMADEGMWMIHSLDEALGKKMAERGLKLSTREIYNADAEGTTLADAVISFGFYCTGSLISGEGLMITNHHCAAGDLFDLSTPGRNLLEEGYWAFRRQDEIPVPGKKVFFLKKVFDVTDEVAALSADLKARGERFGSRKLSSLMEQKYNKEYPGMEASLDVMWGGEKYYLSLYKTYTDIRLVAAPPSVIASFGGDEDNWEWPQHKADFAMYRIYDGGEPLKSKNHLKIARKSVREGDFTMVIGYPGSTARYTTSSFKTDFLENIQLPVENRLQKDRMEIVRRHMDADPSVREKYSDMFFSLSNLQEMREGELQCIKRFHVADKKRDFEKELSGWIAEAPERMARWGGMAGAFAAEYAATADIERQKSIYRETLVRGTFIARTMLRLSNAKPDTRDAILTDGLTKVDARVEKDLLAYSLREYFSLIEPRFTGARQNALRERFTSEGLEGEALYKAMAEYLWNNPYDLMDFITEVKITAYNDAEHHEADLLELQRSYSAANYRMFLDKGIPAAPDANSTMRLTYGRVCPLEPKDGILTYWKTSPEGLLEKNDPSRHDFALPGSYLEFLGESRRGATVNFLTDNDITGGNSGSPVLDAYGRLVGLAFDGNKESLASDIYYTPEYNKCVCVDIHYILDILKRYAGLDRIVKEIKG